jgi:fumarylacetoacetate (FAA) hydrolase
MYQGGSDDFLGPATTPPFARPTGASTSRPSGRHHRRRADGRHARAQALDGVRLLMLANDWSLRNLVPAELAKGFGFVQSKPATAFSPVAVTPDELGDAWQRRPRAPDAAVSVWNGQRSA